MNSLPPIPGPLAGSASLSGSGGAVVSSLTGTPNQIDVSASTGAVTVSLSSTIITPGSLQVPNAGGSATAFQVGSGGGATTGWYFGTLTTGYAGIWDTGITPNATNYAFAATGNTTQVNGQTSLQCLAGGVVKTTLANTAGLGLDITAGTATTNVNALSVTQSWNNAGIALTAVKVNVTDTASASGSLIFDGQVGGTSKFSVSKSSVVTAGGFVITPTNSTDTTINTGSGSVGTLNVGAGGTIGLSLAASGAISITSSWNLNWNWDLFIRRAAAANIQLGAADAASPIAQTLSVQNVVAGTTNTAGANFTIKGSAGTGTGAGGSVIIQVAPAGSSGTSQNAFAAALTIDSTKLATFAGAIVSSTGNITSGDSFVLSNTGRVDFGGQSRILNSSDGVLKFSNNAGTDFSRLQFGGTTSSFPSLKRSTTQIQARLADDSGDASLSASYVKLVPTTVAGLPSAATAGAGARAFVTDSVPTAFGATVTGGGGNARPVWSDGTNWLIG